MNKLIETILTSKRAHNSKGELEFVGKLYQYINGLGLKAVPMAEGCITVQVGEGGKTLFSCHTDTVHSVAESDGSKQNLFFDESFQHIFLADKKASTCLGADDGAGIYIMLKMMEAKVTGTYIFHRGEERGGIGCRAMVDKHADWAKQFNAVVAFDRPNDYEIICTQGGTQCASESYGNALAGALNLAETVFAYEVSHKGVFTDSKVYNHLVPECVNIGVGYANQHGPEEYLNWTHVQQLTAACCKIEWDKLPITRKPAPPPQQQYGFPYGNKQGRYYELPTSKKVTPTKADTKGLNKKATPSIPLFTGKGAVEGFATAEELLEMNFEDLTAELADPSVVEAIMLLQLEVASLEGQLNKLKEMVGLS